MENSETVLVTSGAGAAGVISMLFYCTLQRTCWYLPDFAKLKQTAIFSAEDEVAGINRLAYE